MRTSIRIVSGLILLLPVNACSLLREVTVSRQDSLQTSSQKASLEWEVDSLYSGSRVFSYTDSSGEQYEVEIVPSGAFTFSTKAGFTGSASVVRFRGKSQSNSRGVDSSSANTQVSSSGSLKQHVKVKTQRTEKTRTKTGSNSQWWLAAVLVIGLLSLVLVKRTKLFSKYCSR